MMVKNQTARKILVLILMIIVMLVFSPFIKSCRQELSFGDLIVCGEVDGVTFKPAGTKDSFYIDENEIFAVIEVSGASARDEWKFVWINEDTGKIIAESDGKYSDGDSAHVEGHLSNCLTPADKAGIIGEPGNYSVNFYHNGGLISSAYFTIEPPVPEITRVVLSSEIDGKGQPVDITRIFYPDDVIYTLVELDYQIAGETIGVKWYKGEDELLGEEEVNIEKNYYLPGFIVFEMIDDEPWPVTDYHVDVYRNGLIEDEYIFEVVKREIPDATFCDNNIYRKEDYKFFILYPDSWIYEEGEDNRGLEVNFMPSLEDVDNPVEIKVMVLKEGYYPSGDQYSDFSESILTEVVDTDDGMEIKSGEHTGEINGAICRRINYSYTKEDNSGWDVELIFMEKNNMLYLAIKISDIYYREFAGSLYETMLDSISFD